MESYSLFNVIFSQTFPMSYMADYHLILGLVVATVDDKINLNKIINVRSIPDYCNSQHWLGGWFRMFCKRLWGLPQIVEEMKGILLEPAWAWCWSGSWEQWGFCLSELNWAFSIEDHFQYSIPGQIYPLLQWRGSCWSMSWGDLGISIESVYWFGLKSAWLFCGKAISCPGKSS